VPCALRFSNVPPYMHAFWCLTNGPILLTSGAKPS